MSTILNNERDRSAEPYSIEFDEAWTDESGEAFPYPHPLCYPVKVDTDNPDVKRIVHEAGAAGMKHLAGQALDEVQNIANDLDRLN